MLPLRKGNKRPHFVGEGRETNDPTLYVREENFLSFFLQKYCQHTMFG